MINLFFGNTIQSCSNAIIDALSKKEQGRFAVVLAPDSFLFAFENKVAEMGFSLDVEVMSFSSLARSVLKGSINRCLTPEGCNMIMTRAIKEIKDELVYYKKSVARKGFVSEMYSTITALRNSGISPTDLTNAVSAMHGYVANKTKDLATIYNAYLKTLTEKYSDPTTRLEALLKAMPNDSFIKETEFFVVDFYTFNHKEYEVLGGLFKYAYSVNIGVIDAVGGLSPKSIYPYDNTQMILELTKKSGSGVQRINAYTALDDYERFIVNDMFGLGRVPKLEKNIDLELIEPVSVSDEADSVCMKISELVRNGARYRDIGIVMGDPEDKTLETCLSDYNIPYFKDVKNPLTEEAPIKYLLFAIEASAGNCEMNKVLSLAKNPLSLISPKEAMLFEKYLIKYSINYSRFNEPFTKGEDRERAIPEKVRLKIIEQIPRFPSSATVAEYVKATREFLTKINYQNRLEKFFEKQLAYNDLMGAKRTVQIPTQLVSVLNLCGEILNDYKLSLSDYLDMLQSSFESIKLALIPVRADEVQIGSARDSKFEDLKYLFVVGATDGQIPKESGEGTILTNKYSTDLQLLDMVVHPRVKEENRFGKFDFTQILLKGTKGLYISCPVSNANGNKTTKSEIFDKFTECFGVSIKKAYSTEEISAYVTEKQCLKKLTLAISQSSEELDIFNRSLLSLLTPEDKDRIFALYYDRDNELEDGSIFMDNGQTTTVSKIENFYACPYAFFIRYGLGAKERETQDVKVNETGKFIHAVLEIYFAENGDKIDTINKETAVSKALEIAEKLLENDDRLKAVFGDNPRRVENLKTEASLITANLNELVKQSKLRPFKTEVKFGFDDPDSYPAIELSSGTKVRGMIDRIDTAGDYIVVIDYKTGKVKPKIKEIYYGEKIQLYIYLYALKNLGFTPIGAFYQHVDAKYSKKSDAKYAYLGQFINDPKVLSIIDPNFETNKTSEILPIKLKDGEISIINKDIASLDDVALSEKEFGDVIEYSYKLLEKADNYIRKGYIAPVPLEEKCQYCLAKNICNVKNNEYRKKSSITIEDFNTEDETVDN